MKLTDDLYLAMIVNAFNHFNAHNISDETLHMWMMEDSGYSLY